MLLAGALCCLFFGFFLLAFCYLVDAKFAAHTKVFECTPQHDAYSPKTGDIVLLQHASAGLQAWPLKGLRFVPTHCGMVWVRNHEACVIEASRFTATPMQDVMWNKTQGDGIRVVRLGDLLGTIDVFCAARPLVRGTINESKLEAELATWARHLKFEPRVRVSMGIAETVALGFGPVFPTLGKLAAKFSGLSSSRAEVFCSEFVTKLLQRVGHIDPSFDAHWKFSPISLMHKLGALDALCPELEWGREISLVCPRKR
jgi:hypothetical protein